MTVPPAAPFPSIAHGQGPAAAAVAGPVAAAGGWLVRCHCCDLLQTVPPLAPGTAADCGRCGADLFAHKPGGFQRALALYLAALILLVIANSFPFLTLKIEGQAQSSHMLSGAVDLWKGGMQEVAVAVILFVAVVPLLKILIGLAVVGPLAAGRPARGARRLYRLFDQLHPWAMMEIFLLGVLVSYTKLMGMATVVFGPSLFAFVALIIVMIMADSAVDPHDVWERMMPSRGQGRPAAVDPAELVGCEVCQLVSRVPAAATAAGAVVSCPRCGSALHRRKPQSLSRAAALLLTAVVLYIPANVYPVMTFISLGSGEPSTILGGVEELVAYGMWPLAAIVFTASILVPMLKMISMSYLVISTRRGSRQRLRERSRIYRMNEFVGRWSMVDVFVVTLLAALVQLGSLASITPGAGIVAFAGVVVLTMLAAIAFDPRLMWDAVGAEPAGSAATAKGVKGEGR